MAIKITTNALPSFNHIGIDIKERKKIIELFVELKPNAIVHTTAQPSHGNIRRSKYAKNIRINDKNLNTSKKTGAVIISAITVTLKKFIVISPISRSKSL